MLDRADLLVVVEIGADEGVAAFDVLTEVGQGAFVNELELFEAFLGFFFEYFEEQWEFGDFDGLGVDVYAVDVVE